LNLGQTYDKHRISAVYKESYEKLMTNLLLLLSFITRRRQYTDTYTRH